MTQFSTSDLGRWEDTYRTLVATERHSLTPEGTWMLGDKPGLLAVFDGEEMVYLSATRNLAKALQGLLREGSEHEMRTLAAIVDLGVPAKTAAARARSGPTAQRVTKLLARMLYSVAQAPVPQLEALEGAFVAIADPRYNGRTSLANQAIDRLPR